MVDLVVVGGKALSHSSGDKMDSLNVWIGFGQFSVSSLEQNTRALYNRQIITASKAAYVVHKVNCDHWTLPVILVSSVRT